MLTHYNQIRNGVCFHILAGITGKDICFMEQKQPKVSPRLNGMGLLSIIRADIRYPKNKTLLCIN